MLGLADELGDSEALGLTDRLSDPLGETDALGLVDKLADPLGLPDALGDTLKLAEPLGLALSEAEPDGLPEAEGDLELDGDADCDAVVAVTDCQRPSASTILMPPAVRMQIEPLP